MSQVIRFFESAWACSSVKMRFQVPPLCQRRNRSYTRPQGPYRSGTSRHGAPVRVRHRMPSISCRRVHIGGRPGSVPWGAAAPAGPTVPPSDLHVPQSKIIPRPKPISHTRPNSVRLLMACRTADYRVALTSALAEAFGGAPSPKRLSAGIRSNFGMPRVTTVRLRRRSSSWDNRRISVPCVTGPVTRPNSDAVAASTTTARVGERTLRYPSVSAGGSAKTPFNIPVACPTSIR